MSQTYNRSGSECEIPAAAAPISFGARVLLYKPSLVFCRASAWVSNQAGQTFVQQSQNMILCGLESYTIAGDHYYITGGVTYTLVDYTPHRFLCC